MRFIWKIENFISLNDETLQSPSFVCHNSSWEVRILPIETHTDGDYIYVELHQLLRKTGTLNFAVALLDDEGLPLIWREKKNFVLVDSERNVILFRIKRDEVISQRRTELLPSGNLTVQCIIWQSAAELFATDSFCICTRNEPLVDEWEKIFTWNVNTAGSLVPNLNITHEEIFNGGSLMIQLFFNDHKQLKARLWTTRQSRIHAKCKISILGTARKNIQYAEDKFYFFDKDTKWLFDTNITEDLLMCYRNQFVPNNTLSLVFNCTLSYNVSSDHHIPENDIFTNNPAPIADSLRIPEHGGSSIVPDGMQNNRSDSSDTISKVIRNIYEEGFLSDFSLRVQDRTFPVHKAILGARSSVFRAMFTADMKEKESGSVDIPDVDADTIQRMLKFVYWDNVDKNMQWESASSLYVAADKYALESLKQKCSDLLKSGLSSSSVLDVLLLADSHQDQDLKAITMEFIGKNDKDVIGTERWSKFAEENGLLAFDTMQKLYLKKMDA